MVEKKDEKLWKSQDVKEESQENVGEQGTGPSDEPGGDVTSERTEKQVVTGTIHPDKEG